MVLEITVTDIFKKKMTRWSISSQKYNLRVNQMDMPKLKTTITKNKSSIDGLKRRLDTAEGKLSTLKDKAFKNNQNG